MPVQTTPLDEIRSTDRPTPDPAKPAAGSRTRWWILAMVSLAQLMVVLDATIVNIALPSAQQAIGFSNDDRQWVVTAYALAFGSLLLVGGRLGDLLGRKRTFMIGLAGFALTSAVGGAASTFGILVAARAGQGLFGALLAPAALSLLTTTFTTPHERGRAFAIFGAIAGAGGAIGLILGGTLTEYLSWRWCLYVNLPIAVIALAGALALLPRHPRDADAARIDVLGAGLSVAGLVSLVYGLASAESHGWTSLSTLGFIGVGLVLLVLFVVAETRVDSPLLPLAVLTDRNRGGSFVAIAVIGAGMFGVFLFLTYYLSTVLGYGPLPTGVAFLPMIAGIVVAAQLSAPLVERIGVKVPVTLGFLVAAAGMALLTRLQVDSSYLTGVLPGLMVVGVGMGLVFAPSMSAATDRVDPEHAGVASAAVNTFQQIGGSIGTAVLSALAASAASGYLEGRDPGDADTVLRAALESYTTAFGWSAVVFVVGGLISAVLLRHGALVRDPDAAPVAGH